MSASLYTCNWMRKMPKTLLNPDHFADSFCSEVFNLDRRKCLDTILCKYNSKNQEFSIIKSSHGYLCEDVTWCSQVVTQIIFCQERFEGLGPDFGCQVSKSFWPGRVGHVNLLSWNLWRFFSHEWRNLRWPKDSTTPSIITYSYTSCMLQIVCPSVLVKELQDRNGVVTILFHRIKSSSCNMYKSPELESEDGQVQHVAWHRCFDYVISSFPTLVWRPDCKGCWMWAYDD